MSEPSSPPSEESASGSAAGGRPGLRERLTRAASDLSCVVSRLRPPARALTGAGLGAACVALILAGCFGRLLRSGGGIALDVALTALATLAVVLVASGLPDLIIGAVAFLRRLVGRVGVGASVAVFVLLYKARLPVDAALLVTASLCLPVMLLCGSLAEISDEGLRRSTRCGKIVTCTLGLLGLGGIVVVFIFVSGDGSTSHLANAVSSSPVSSSPVRDSDDRARPNPAAPGPFEVRTLTYGSGTDLHRPEFAAGATLRTRTVDGTSFVRMPPGWTGLLRERFWGFGAERLPLNGRVWHPTGEGPFPLVLIVHGNHAMTEFSDPGYAYLGELLASRGFIVVSVDQNFLNRGDPLSGKLHEENDARAWLLLEHIRVWREWNQTAGHPFEGVVDVENLALIGHSRGGEAVAHAALFNRLTHYPDDARVTFDYGYSLKAIVSIAPTDGQYRPADRNTRISDISFLTLQGGHDADVSSFLGDQLYHRVAFTGPGAWFKASVYLHRANHGQFNTVWGSEDLEPARAWFLNRAALLPGDIQRQVAAFYCCAFLEATLKGRRELVRLFRDPRVAKARFPDVLSVSRFEDATFRPVADFEEDADVTTASIEGAGLSGRDLLVWREGDIKLRNGSRRGNGAVFLGWGPEGEALDPPADEDSSTAPSSCPSYVMTLPDAAAYDLQVSGHTSLVLHVAAQRETELKSRGLGRREDDEDGGPLDFSVELATAAGVTARLPLSRFGEIAPPLEARFTRLRELERTYKSAFEPVLQTIELPLASFVEVAPELRVDEVTEIRFIFDRTARGMIIVDRIGFMESGE